MSEEIEGTSMFSPNTKSGNKQIVLSSLGIVAALLIVTLILLAYKVLTLPGFVIPEHIASSASHTIFVPQRLPQGYTVVDGSFGISEEGGIIFQAEDSSGSSIAFTEQKTPDKFDFEAFYQKDMRAAKKLSNTPYPSVIGKLPNGDKILLSIVADDTWIFVSTAAPLGEQDLLTIAKSIKKY